jgi:uncharacterized protein (TIGR02996 family)
MSTLRQALEDALVDDPQDQAAHAAYADFLTEQGDPRGEFISVQLALEDATRTPEERQRLRAREQELLAAHRRDWLGGLADVLAAEQLHFAWGWLDRICISDLDKAQARLLANAPETRLLRELIIEGDSYLQTANGDPLWDDTLRRHRHATDVLAQSPYLGNVRFLRLGLIVEDDSEDCPYEDAHMSSPAVPDLVARMPRLEELHLFTKRYYPSRFFGSWTLHNLRVLRMYHLQARHPLEILANNPYLGKLTHLLLHPHGFADPDEPYLDLAGVRAVVRSPHLRSLTHLQIRLCPMGDAGCEEIVASGILKRLKTLDLRHGCITDAGARILAACPDLVNLELLDVNRNGLTQDGIAALEATGVRLRARNQQIEG